MLKNNIVCFPGLHLSIVQFYVFVLSWNAFAGSQIDDLVLVDFFHNWEESFEEKFFEDSGYDG
jgi:hypothetical protein